MVTALLVPLFVCVTVTVACEFPDFVQSRRPNAKRREWYRHVTSGRGQPVIVNFYGDVMQTLVVGTNETFSRECTLEISSGRFLCAQKNDANDHVSFVCMRFLQRSDNIIQVMFSRPSTNEDPSLCSDTSLRLDDWPLINRANFFSNYEPCPLSGGFNTWMFDRRNKKGICDSYTGETRIESDCTTGEGMYFRFRHDHCVPEGFYMSRIQRVYCMGSWQSNSSTFVVLRHASAVHAWCFRYPTKHGREFVASLFRDVHCNRRVESDDDYLSLSIRQDESPPMSSLCNDDYEACSYWSRPCSHTGSVMQLTCSKMCGVCDSSRPAPCALPHRSQGSWLDVSNPSNATTIRITDSVLQMANWEEFHCVKWDSPLFLLASNVIERMLVTTFDNGCRPHYSCAKLRQYSESVLRLKLSQPQVWPFENTNGQNIDCSSFRYRDDDQPLGARYRSRHYKTLIAATRRVYVDCRLGDTRRFNATFDDGATCSGWLTQEGQKTHNKMTLMLDGCRKHPAKTQFACLDVLLHGPVSDVLVVTETLQTTSQFSCWLFPTGLTFYRLAMADCNEAASERLTSGLIKPLVTFREALPVTTSPETPAPCFEDEPVYQKEEMTSIKTEKRETGAAGPRALSSGSRRCGVGVSLPVLLLVPWLLLAT